MASSSRPGPPAGGRSGGKIVNRRRATARSTPYDRPPPPPSPPSSSGSPNWLTGRIFPATKRLATGAGKLLYSVFTDVSSSSSSSSSDADAGSAGDDVDDDGNYDDAPSYETDVLNEGKTALETIQSFEKKSQLHPGKSGSKHMIETLLMQESFSWQECDRLTKIIKSRVVDSPTINGEQVDRETPRRTTNADLADAIKEAKRWLEERKMGSSSKSDMNYGTHDYNSLMRQHVKDGDVNSPVDVAKLYMQARPPWASPSIKPLETSTASPMAVELFGEERPYWVGGNSFPSSKKRDYLACGPWSIEEEIRKVRAKATDDMLRSLPSKLDLSPYTGEPKTAKFSSMPDKAIVGAGYKMHDLDTVAAALSVDTSSILATGLDGNHGVPVSEKTQQGDRNEASSSAPDVIVSERNQDLEAQHNLGGGCDAPKLNHSTSPWDVQYQLTEKEAASLTDRSNRNGFPPNLSLPAGLDTEKEPRDCDEGNTDQFNSGPGKTTVDINVEANCELLSEAFIEFPVVNQTNSIAGDSQDSSSMHYEEQSQKLPRLRSEDSAVQTGSIVEKKQLARKPSRHSSRSRGKGRS